MQEKLQHFIEVWQQSESFHEVMEKLGMTYANVSTMASRLRKRGVALKKFNKANKYRDVNWDELAEYAKKFGQ